MRFHPHGAIRGVQRSPNLVLDWLYIHIKDSPRTQLENPDKDDYIIVGYYMSNIIKVGRKIRARVVQWWGKDRNIVETK